MRFFAALLLVTFASAASAQERDHAPLLLELPANTRALGMGNAFVIGSSDPTAIFYNPAMSNAAGFALDIQRYAGEANTVSAAAGTDWWNGRVAIGIQAAGYSVSPSELFGGVDESDLVDAGIQDVSEFLAAFSYGRSLFGVRFALTGKLIDQRAAGEHATTPALDLSSGIDIADFNVGLSVQNVGLEYDFLGLELTHPLRVTLGAAFDGSAPLGPLDIMAAAAVSREADGSIVPGAGVEIGYWPIVGRTFFLRAGLRDPDDPDTAPWTLGAGFAGDRINLDWAVVDFDGGVGHRVSLRFR